MPFAVLEKQFDLLTVERQKFVFSYVNFLLSEQENEMKISSSGVSEKIALLDSLAGIVPSDITKSPVDYIKSYLWNINPRFLEGYQTFLYL